MARSADVLSDDDLEAFVRAQVREGRYASESDVLTAGLRLLREGDARLEAYRAAIDEGERSGEPVAFDFDRFIESKRAGPAPQ
ncbi:type II toxin-antitoxin system ParD family antitoxin [Rhizobium sp. TRM95111]|uniref:type II toxin-antitoxin system ParD family antitoxin n=1 Tax=Rhizobium alarense TaxID=2846851 RepID=UPI001F48644F|nr:type II toxin-antitoxin system ParD family antitoxin [Rhizobium alarense]MCF3640040.1 type II toxin-antitoxin system ParD family antitoxin [Rhizobium alarense]